MSSLLVGSVMNISFVLYLLIYQSACYVLYSLVIFLYLIKGIHLGFVVEKVCRFLHIYISNIVIHCSFASISISRYLAC